jgi:hypothetical protein
MYAYQMWASAFAYMRLRRGLPLTFEIRKQCAIETFKCLAVYAIYLSIMMFFFAIISSLDPNPPLGSQLNNFSLFLLFVVANRGSVDGLVWFMLHDFMRDGKELKKSDEVIDMEANIDRNNSERRKLDGEYSEELNKNSNNDDDDDEDERPPVPGRLSRRPSIFTAPIAGTYYTFSLHVLTLHIL